MILCEDGIFNSLEYRKEFQGTPWNSKKLQKTPWNSWKLLETPENSRELQETPGNSRTFITFDRVDGFSNNIGNHSIWIDFRDSLDYVGTTCLVIFQSILDQFVRLTTNQSKNIIDVGYELTNNSALKVMSYYSRIWIVTKNTIVNVNHFCTKTIE